MDLPAAGGPARGVAPGETDDLIDVIRTAREADVAAVLKQQRDGRFKVSVRSRGDHDLAAIAAAFGGGGHRLAAGLHERARPRRHDRATSCAALAAGGSGATRDGGPRASLLIDKPRGITSHDAVARSAARSPRKKVGHAGTLDPMATGLLVMGVGRATRLLRFLGDLPKTYEGTFRLGVETDDAGRRRRGGRARPPVDVDREDAVRAAMDAQARRERAAPARVQRREGRRPQAVRGGARRASRSRRAPRIVRVDRFDLVGDARRRGRLRGRR